MGLVHIIGGRKVGEIKLNFIKELMKKAPTKVSAFTALTAKILLNKLPLRRTMDN